MTHGTEQGDDGRPGLAVRLLGPVRAQLDLREVPLGPPLQRALFTVLAVRHDQVVGTTELIDAVWGEDLPGNPEGGVHTYVAGLRRALEPGRTRRSPGRHLLSHPSGYRLTLPAEASDLARFEKLRDEGRRAWRAGRAEAAEQLLDRALALFDGTALGGVPGPFAQSQRSWLGEQRIAVAEDRIDVLLARGRYGDAIAAARPLTDGQPLRERPWAQLMTALYRDGRQSEALAAYDRARAAAVEALGLDPGPLLAGLRQRIVVADPALLADRPRQPDAAAARVNLPRDTDHFVGRGREVARVLAAAGSGVCAIDGMAGVGKTTLAVHAAGLLAPRYPDVRLHLDLHGHAQGRAPVPAAAALEKLLLAVGVPGDRIPAAADDRAGLWRAQLAGRRALLVLDDAVDAGQVRPLLPGSPSSLVLITSRRRLSGLDAGESLSLDVLPYGDAVALLAAVAGDGRVAAERDAAGEVVRACGLLPLAVQIAAARLRHRRAWSVAHLRDRLAGEDRRLDELTAQDRSVAVAFSLSYRSLDGPRRQMFRLLGLFPGPRIGLPAAAALAGVDQRRADTLLQDLVDVQLLEEPRPGRYRLHDLLAVYAARECARTEDEQGRQAALARLLDFYLATVDGAEEVLRPQRLDRAQVPADAPRERFADRAAALAWLDEERGAFAPLIAAAARAGRHRHAWQLARCLWGFFESRGHWAEWITTHELGLPSARLLGDKLAEARLLVGLGVAEHFLRRYDEAVGHYRSALALMRETGFRSGEAGVLTNLGNTFRRMGRLAECIECQEQALEISRAAGDQAGEGIVLANLGELYRDAGLLQQSVAAQEQALAMFRKWGERRLEGSVLDGLARAHLAMGALDQALAHGGEALECRRGCGDRSGEAETLDCLGSVHLRAGRRDAAADCWRRALAIAEDLDAPTAADIRRRLAGI
ncbi:AfsR/SARP family transcriptional regulator [Actinacidiphila acididurans]|uniref:Tetratricopeptide repeat protein n=1 Tax=Actinacidiphila acididurans TaxID=2784346 RepID=A0ABS2TXU2_9ACTN|nr:BTAD domain-containing putative transcriptional regulator [Actinacidiphila acididurans]MBM9508161.1 tetratricopeptide repeat protein [Actinacidiphila acididurans]